jgi:hypothetical protein
MRNFGKFITEENGKHFFDMLAYQDSDSYDDGMIDLEDGDSIIWSKEGVRFNGTLRSNTGCSSFFRLDNVEVLP